MTSLFVLSFVVAATAQTYDAWTLEAVGPWTPREGVMGASLDGKIFLVGGRSGGGVVFTDDVYSSNEGSNWELVHESAGFGGRAYHILLAQSDCLFMMGGQNFSHFFSDVWKSCDYGTTWAMLTDHAWPARAGLSAVAMSDGTMVVAGGCYNNEKGVRSFRGDVWSSVDGVTWSLMTDSPGWIPRSGPRLVEFKDELIIVAGEIGFTPATQLVDIWSSADKGATWKLVAETPEFSARSGHGVVVMGDMLVLVAGWYNLHDLWISHDGAQWTMVSDDVWKCSAANCGKYDFWSLEHEGSLYTLGGSGAYSTFGKLYNETWSLAF